MSDEKGSMSPGSGRSPLRPFLRPASGAPERSDAGGQPAPRVLRPFVKPRGGPSRESIQSVGGAALAEVAPAASELEEEPDAWQVPVQVVEASVDEAHTQPEQGDPNERAEAPVVVEPPVAASASAPEIGSFAPDVQAEEPSMSIAADLAWLTDAASESFVSAAVDVLEESPSTVPVAAPADDRARTIAARLRAIADDVEQGRIPLTVSSERGDVAATLTAVLASVVLGTE